MTSVAAASRRQVVNLAENRRPEMCRRMHKYLEHGPSQRPNLL
jgi:hypothetical protein